MKKITYSGIIIPLMVILLSATSLKSQITIGFQGAEPSDTWSYTTTGAGPEAIGESTLAPNIVSGGASIVAGGNTGGGSCFSGGSGNGPSTPRTITFSSLNIAASTSYTRTLVFNWGNRSPACNGTGWDSGENLTFQAYHDGVAQPVATLAVGGNNAAFDIHNNQYTWSIPPCVQTFSFYVSVTTNRKDELLLLDNVTVTTPSLNPAITQPPAIAGNTLVCQGAMDQYSVTPMPELVYTWSNLPPGASFASLNGSVASSSVTVNWGTATAGTYSLLVTPSDICNLNTGPSQTLAVTILPPPSPLSISGPTSLCAGNTITLTSSYSGGNTWSTGAGTPTLAVSSGGVYSLTTTTSCGPLNASYTVSLNPAPDASITPGGPTTVCQGGSVALSSASATGNAWSTGATTQTINVTTTGTYSVVVSNVCGTDTSSVSVIVNPTAITVSITPNGPASFCAGDSVMLSSNFSSGNAWSTGATTPTIMVHNAGTYTLTVSLTCASGSATQTVAITPIATASISAAGSTTFCAGNSVVLSSNSLNGNVWSTGATTSSISVSTGGIYSLTVTAACGTATASTQVQVNPLPTASITASGATSLCAGDSVLLTASGGNTYLWSNGATSTSIYGHPGNAYTVRSANGCGQVISSAVVISQLPSPNAQITGGVNICQGDSLLLTASGGSTFSWSTGSVASSVYAHGSGTYSVAVSNACGTSTAATSVLVSTVTAGFTADVTSGNPPLAVHFNNTSSSNVTGANWNFGDGGSGSTNASPAHTFNAPGVYHVVLTVTNGNGCQSTYTMQIVVNEQSSVLIIPNVFTPNQDHVNDVFIVHAKGISDFNMSIYDRWGILMAQSTDIAKGWDGRSSGGSDVPEGTYYYIIQARGDDAKDYNEKGPVTLLR